MDSYICQKMDKTIRSNVLSEEFWRMLNLVVKILELIVAALKSFESDTSILLTVYLCFNKLMKQIGEIS